MLFAETDWANIAALFSSLVLNVALVVYLAVRKDRREDIQINSQTQDADAARDKVRQDANIAREETIIEQLNKFNRDREKRYTEDIVRMRSQHAEDISRVERRLTERDRDFAAMAERERECQITQAKQSVEIANNKQCIAELEAENKQNRELIDKLESTMSELKAELRSRGGIASDSGKIPPPLDRI